MNHPNTIKHPDNFDKSQWSLVCPYCYRTVGFDGIFHWGWVLESIGYLKGLTKIQPMDFDGVIERHLHYLIFETKDVKMDISQAQLWTLERLNRAKSFCIMKVWGKEIPDSFEAQVRFRSGKVCDKTVGNGIIEAKSYVEKWFRWADKHR